MPNVSFRRLRTGAGVTDLYVDGDAKVEIVEAKRAADHGYVRDALGQLLDYAAHNPQPISPLRRYSHDASQKSTFGCFTGTAWIVRIERAMDCSNAATPPAQIAIVRVKSGTIRPAYYSHKRHLRLVESQSSTSDRSPSTGPWRINSLRR
jgi:hypothetical protein